MSDPSLRDLLDVAVEAAWLGGRRTLAYFNAGVAVETKSDDTPVTRADREAEEVIRARITSAFPSHSILGEETGATAGDPRFNWIIDPLDGTKSFIHGVPLYRASGPSIFRRWMRWCAPRPASGAAGTAGSRECRRSIASKTRPSRVRRS
jgi:hypothetical protein